MYILSPRKCRSGTYQTVNDSNTTQDAAVAAEQEGEHLMSTDEQAATKEDVSETLAGEFIASAEVLAKADKARAQLAARGLGQVWVEKKWWGFEVHLDEHAAKDISAIESEVADIVSAVIPKLGDLIALCIKIHAAWIALVNSGYGVKCVSPWIAPVWLIPIGKRPIEDTSLWWTVYESGTGWSEDQKFTAHHSGSNPAMAEFNDRLYLVHRGYGAGDNHLWWTVYDPDTGWGADQKFPAHGSGAGPALAVFDGKLHCVHKGADDSFLWHTSFNGTSWSTDTKLPHHGTSVGPALAVFNGKLHCVHKGGDVSHLWHTTFNGTIWSADTQLPGHTTASNPALAVYGGKLHLVHRGGGTDVALYHATFDGTRWSADTKLPAHSSLEGPGLTVLGNNLYCVHRGYGSGDQNLWWCYYNGSSWSTDQKFPGHTSGAGPAVVAYRDKHGTHDQILVVHRGYGVRAAGTDAAEVEAQVAAEERAAAAQGTGSA